MARSTEERKTATPSTNERVIVLQEKSLLHAEQESVAPSNYQEHPLRIESAFKEASSSQTSAVPASNLLQGTASSDTEKTSFSSSYSRTEEEDLVSPSSDTAQSRKNNPFPSSLLPQPDSEKTSDAAPQASTLRSSLIRIEPSPEEVLTPGTDLLPGRMPFSATGSGLNSVLLKSTVFAQANDFTPQENHTAVETASNRVTLRSTVFDDFTNNTSDNITPSSNPNNNSTASFMSALLATEKSADPSKDESSSISLGSRILHSHSERDTNSSATAPLSQTREKSKVSTTSDDPFASLLRDETFSTTVAHKPSDHENHEAQHTDTPLISTSVSAHATETSSAQGAQTGTIHTFSTEGRAIFEQTSTGQSHAEKQQGEEPVTTTNSSAADSQNDQDTTAAASHIAASTPHTSDTLIGDAEAHEPIQPDNPLAPQDTSEESTVRISTKRDEAILNSSNASAPPQQAAPQELGLAPSEVDFLPPFLQSLITLFRLHGKRISGAHLQSALGNSAPSMAACQRAARSLGLDSRLVHRPNLSEISHLVLPCLLMLTGNRSCVLTSLNAEENTAEVIFPEFGHDSTSVPLDSLIQEYSGYALFASLDPDEDRLLRPLAQAGERRWFWDVILHYSPMYKQVVLISLVTNLLALIAPLFIMNVYDRVVPNLAYETLWVLGAGAIVGYVFEFFLRLMRSMFTERASRNIDVVLSTRLMQQILGMRMADRPASSGALMNNMNEFAMLRDFFSATTLLTLVDLPFLVFFLFIVAFIGGSIVIIPIFAVFFLLFAVYSAQRTLRRYSIVSHEGNIEKNAHLVELVTGLEAIKMAAAENRMLQIWEKIVGYCAGNTEREKKVNVYAVNLALFIAHVVSIALIIWGVYLIGENAMTVGGLIACNMLIGRAMSFIVQLAMLLTRYQQARIALTTLNRLMDLPPERKSEAPNVDFGHLPHSLEFTHASFTYSGAHVPTIRDMNLIIRPGEKVAIIGNMGSGKSTLTRLLVGLYEPSEGAVKFGGVDLRQLDITELRTRIGFMPQEAVLFHGSVRDNIALGTPYIKDQLILRAAWLAGVTDFVRQNPAGFAMQVGERGNNLSGGQRQAVSLARALLHDPDVIILDEPTSNIDGLTETAIKNRLRTILKNKTLIINMHRMSLLDLVDRVIVLSDGIIVADGPKHEVLKRLRG